MSSNKSILVVEDDENKRQQLELFIKEVFPSVSVEFSKSFHSGLKSILEKRQHVILLDMTMPTYDIGHDEDGGRIQHYAGREILRQMDRRKICTPVIVITQFDVFGEGPDSLTRAQLDKQLRVDHPNTYQGTVYYNVAMDEWKPALLRLMTKLFKE